MNQREACFDNIQAVEKQYNAAALAVGWCISANSKDAAVGRALKGKAIAVGDLIRCQRNLEKVYAIWLFAEFEAALRVFWKAVKKKQTRPLMEVLVNAIAARRGISQKIRDDAHRVREFRNDLIHGDGTAQPLSLPECRSFLCKFLSYLPQEF